MIEQIWDTPAVFRIPVELPQNPLKNLNVYVIRNAKSSLVIDTGFHRPECQRALWAGLEELELNLSETALFLTHFHADHTGLVWDFVKRGIPVYLGKTDWDYYRRLQAERLMPALEELFASEGFPEEQRRLQATGNQGRLYAPEPGFPVIPVEDGQTLSVGGLEVTAICTPGHTPGHTVLYLPEQQLLFSGDHILFDITPNISVWPGVEGSLSSYLASLRKIRALPIRAAFPAHRGGGTGVYQRIDELLEHHSRRLDEIERTIRALPGITAYEVSGRIRWSARNLTWEEFPPHQRWFAMGETLAHLYELADRGRIRREIGGETIHYYPA